MVHRQSGSIKNAGGASRLKNLSEYKKFAKEVDRWIRRFIERLVSHLGDSMQIEAAE